MNSSSLLRFAASIGCVGALRRAIVRGLSIEGRGLAVLARMEFDTVLSAGSSWRRLRNSAFSRSSFAGIASSSNADHRLPLQKVTASTDAP